MHSAGVSTNGAVQRNSVFHIDSYHSCLNTSQQHLKISRSKPRSPHRPLPFPFPLPCHEKCSLRFPYWLPLDSHHLHSETRLHPQHKAPQHPKPCPSHQQHPSSDHCSFYTCPSDVLSPVCMGPE